MTGSDATGRKVGAAAGEALAGVVLELGGKSPQLGFDNGQESLAHFTRRKSVWIDYSGRAKELGAT